MSTYIRHTYFTGRFVLVRGGSCPGYFVRVFFVWKLLFVVVLSVPLLSEYIRYNRKLNITLNFRFHMCEKNLKSVMLHVLVPPPLCHKLSHFLGPPPPLERDALYGRPLMVKIGAPIVRYHFSDKSRCHCSLSHGYFYSASSHTHTHTRRRRRLHKAYSSI